MSQNPIFNTPRKANGLPNIKVPASQPFKEWHEHLVSRGYTLETIKKFKLGRAKTHGADRLVIPFEDEHGVLVAKITHAQVTSYPCNQCAQEVWATDIYHLQKRGQSVTCPHCNSSALNNGLTILLDQYPKYKIPAGLQTKERLYNAFNAKLECQQTNLPIVVCEGYSDVWAASQAGYPAVAYNGVHLSDTQIKLLADISDQIILAPDFDASGILAGNKNGALLIQNNFNVQKVSELPYGRADLADVLKTHQTKALKKVLETKLVQV